VKVEGDMWIRAERSEASSICVGTIVVGGVSCIIVMSFADGMMVEVVYFRWTDKFGQQAALSTPR
jgi:hypothetical protein